MLSKSYQSPCLYANMRSDVLHWPRIWILLLDRALLSIHRSSERSLLIDCTLLWDNYGIDDEIQVCNGISVLTWS